VPHPIEKGYIFSVEVISSQFASLLHIKGEFVGAGLTRLSVGRRDVSLNPRLQKNDSTKHDIIFSPIN
jgi:hypothetical protein